MHNKSFFRYCGLISHALVAGMLLLAPDAFARPTATEPSGSGVRGTEGAFEHLFQKVETRTLQNGLRVAVYRRGEAPVFAGVVAVRVGGSDEQVGETGISHMFEHMAFKGTPEIGVTDAAREKALLDELEELAPHQFEVRGFSPEQKARWDKIHEELRTLWITDQFTREYELRGASGLNATTDSEITKYFVNLPRSEFEFWLYMESERLLRPVLRQFYQERDVVREERRMRYEDDPDGKLYELLRSASFIAHPYKNPVIGFPFDIERLTASHLEAFRRRFYVPSNIAVALVGDIRPEVDWPLIEKYFGRIPSGPKPERPFAVEPPQEGERRVTLEMKASPQFIIAYHKPVYPHPDDAALSIMAEMLTGGRTSMLQRRLVFKDQVAVSVDHSEAPGSAYPNLLTFGVVPRAPHNNEEVLKAFDRTLREFMDSGIDQEHLEIAKRSEAVAYLSSLSSNSTMGTNLAEAIVMYGNWKAPFEWYEQAMKVSLADVKRVASQYLTPQNRTIAFLETKVAHRDIAELPAKH